MKQVIAVCVLTAMLFGAAPAITDLCVPAPDYNDGWPWPSKQRWKDVAGNMYRRGGHSQVRATTMAQPQALTMRSLEIS